MAQAGLLVEQHFGNAKASHGSVLFQGYVNGPVHIHEPGRDTSLERSLERLDILHEASFDSHRMQHVATCLPNTRRDILAQIRTWVDGGDARHIFWLKGWAGTGKSTIALTVAREYSIKKQLGASFFFSRGGGDLASTRRFATTIAVHLAEACPQLHKHIADAAAARRISGLGLFDQWERLIVQPLKQLSKPAFPHPLVIVVDALDECDNKDDVSLLIRCLTNAVAVRNVDLRIFVTSRPDKPVNVGFGDISPDTHQDIILHDINQSIVDQDLTVYYKQKFKRIALSSTEASHFEDAIPILVTNSCGLFIYAATACRFICEKELVARDRLAQLVRLPIGADLPVGAEKALDQMYTTVLQQYSQTTELNLNPAETTTVRRLFRHVIGTIAVLSDALSLASLAMLLNQSKDRIARLLSSFHSLLDVPEEEDGLIRLLHPSFREFLLDSQRCSNAAFYIDAKKAHRHLFGCCLEAMSKYLRKDMCGFRRPGTRVGNILRSDVNKKVPFAVQYACRYWVYHLERSQIDFQEHVGIAQFFEARFLFWLETLALIGRLADGIAMLQLLETRAPESTASEFRGQSSQTDAQLVPKHTQNCPTLRAVVYDAKRFLKSHGSIIEEAPLQVYCSALVFSPEASIIRQRYIDQLPKWIIRAPALLKDWSVHLQTLQGHSSQVYAVAFSPDGRLIVSGSGDKTIRVWDAATGAERRVLHGHSSWVRAVAFSPDSRLIVSGSNDNTIRIWDAATGAERRVLYGHSRVVYAVAFSPDGRLIVSGAADNTIRIWTAATGAERRILQSFAREVNAVAFSPDGRLIVSGSSDNTVRIWDATTGAERRILQSNSSEVYAAAFSPDGQLIVSGSNDKTIRVWDTATGAERRVLHGHSGWVLAVAFSPDGQLIVSGSRDNTIRVWHTATGAERRVLQGHSRKVNAVAFSPDGRLIVSGSDDNTVHIWDAATGAERRILQSYSSEVYAAAFSPDGRLIVSSSSDNTVRVWDAATGAELRILQGHSSWVRSVAFSPDSRLIVSGSGDNTVRVWDAATGGAERRILNGHSSWVHAVAFSPDGRLIVSGSGDKTIRVWYAGDERRILQGHSSWVLAVVFSPDGRFIVSASDDNTVRVWDTATGAERRVLQGHSSFVQAVAFSPDDRLIVSGSNDKTVRVWDAATGAELRILQGHSSWVRAVAFSPDGRLIVSDSGDKTVRVWDAATGAERRVLQGDTNTVLFCSPSGKHVVTDRGILGLPHPDCRCLHHIFATESWITQNGEELLYLHPDYRDFVFISGGVVAYMREISYSLEMDLSRGRDILSAADVAPTGPH